MPTPQPVMWEKIQLLLHRGVWVSLQDIYDLVEREINLTTDDFGPSSDNSREPR